MQTPPFPLPDPATLDKLSASEVLIYFVVLAALGTVAQVAIQVVRMVKETKREQGAGPCNVPSEHVNQGRVAMGKLDSNQQEVRYMLSSLTTAVQAHSISNATLADNLSKHTERLIEVLAELRARSRRRD